MNKIFLILMLFTSAVYASDIYFGKIEYSKLGYNRISLDTSTGYVECSNNIDYVCPNYGIRGKFLIQGYEGEVVSISCSTNGYISYLSQTIALEEIKIFLNGVIYECKGLSQEATNHTISEIPSFNTIYIGGTLLINETISNSQNYNSNNIGGEPIAIRYIYQ